MISILKGIGMGIGIVIGLVLCFLIVGCISLNILFG